jgi:serine/threonine-protein kinase
MDGDIVTMATAIGLIVGVSKYFKYKMRQLELSHRGDPRELEALRSERKQLEARVQNLESIVCSVDLELNARLNRLAAHQSAIGALAPAALSPSAPLAPTQLAAAPAPATPIAPIGPIVIGHKVAGRYLIERELGQGGMGTVYLARDEQLGERVAVKVIAASQASDPAAAAERFRREVAAARKVTHQNVVRIHDLTEEGPRLLLSMEYVDGMTLASYLGRVGAVRLDEARHLLGQICDALCAAHQAGIVHRDLKPQNVLLDHEKRVKVIDFGLARATFMAGMTATGLILGTPEYMAPEQVRGLGCDARTDLYSLGAMAYHVVTGRPPFSGETPIAVGFQHVTEAPRPPRQLRSDLPESVDAAILKALSKDPQQRFADAADFKRALNA